MARVGDFHDLGVNHRHIQGGGHAIVQEGGVGHQAVFGVEVFLVQRPANALGSGPLDLSFHVARVDSSARIDKGGVAQNVHLSCLRVHLHVHNVAAESGTHSSAIGRYGTGDRTASAQE